VTNKIENREKNEVLHRVKEEQKVLHSKRKGG